MIAEAPVTLAVEAGVTLAGRLATPPGPRGGIAVCHPHPLYGGDMDNPVVVRAVEVAAGVGLATIRFNFRGVGGSTGTHGGGEAEQRDLLAAVAHLRTTVGAGAPVVVAGYSFGSLVAADVAAASDVAGLALIAPPVGLGDSRRLPALPPHLAIAVIVGSDDEYCPPDATARLRTELPSARVTVIDGANHFFFGKLFPLGEALREWLPSTLAR